MAVRRAFLALPLLAACATSETPVNPTPPSYDYLLPLRLDVADIEHVPAAPGPASRVDPPAPLSPATLAAQMGRERVFAAGTRGLGRFAVERATLTRERTGGGGVFATPTERLVVDIAVQVEILNPERQRIGFARAEVRRMASGPASAGLAERTVRQAMDDLNVEFEFQVRRNLRGSLVTAAPEPGGVQREDLPRS